MLLAGLATGYAAYAAWSTIGLRWVEISIARKDIEGNVTDIGTAAFRGTESMAGTFAQAIVVVLGVAAVLWFFFGLQRGWTIAWFASPAIGIVAAILAVGGTILSVVLWFVWKDAVVANATRFGVTREELVEVLEDVERSPVVDLTRLAGPTRFGTMILLALAASCAAWWAYRKRTS
ncbi:MAG TPA: hypothetical protein VEC15_05410 [Actinomycetota bacterium]|nr:hypothetical protein [Actinomycetota bacterium]